jgi:acyl-CoA thioesterase
MKSPEEILELMLAKDAFSKWMKLKVLSITKGSCKLEMKIAQQMLNGFDMLHGGVIHSLSDSALAFASNSYGNKCVSIETSISYLVSVGLNEILIAEAQELHRGKSIGVYEVLVFNQKAEKVAILKGTVNISEEIW